MSNESNKKADLRGRKERQIASGLFPLENVWAVQGLEHVCKPDRKWSGIPWPPEGQPRKNPQNSVTVLPRTTGKAQAKTYSSVMKTTW